MILTTKETSILAALRAHVEDFEHTDEQWGSVYIDNAKPADMSPRSFAGVLAALERKGLYRSQGDDAFGYVRMPPRPAYGPGIDGPEHGQGIDAPWLEPSDESLKRTLIAALERLTNEQAGHVHAALADWLQQALDAIDDDDTPAPPSMRAAVEAVGVVVNAGDAWRADLADERAIASEEARLARDGKR